MAIRARGLLPGCDQQHAACPPNGTADRPLIDGRTQWTPLSAAIDKRTVSSVAEGTGRMLRTVRARETRFQQNVTVNVPYIRATSLLQLYTLP